jgi:hypothetical protein
LKDYDIREKVQYFVSDNASENDCTTRLICEDILPMIKPMERRIRCSGHILNLVAGAILHAAGLSHAERAMLKIASIDDDALWTQSGPIGKLHRVAVYLGRSPQRRERFLALQSTQRLASRKFNPDDPDIPIHGVGLFQAGGIRWNSVYLMIERGYRLKLFINAFIKDEIRRGDYPESGAFAEGEWDQLQSFMLILEPLFDLTKRTEGLAVAGSHGALWEVITMQNHLFIELDRLQDMEDPDSLISQGILLLFISTD